MKVNLKIVAGVGATLLAAGAANAAVLTNASPANYSKEGIATTGNDIVLPDVVVTLAANYSADDRIAVTVSGATVTAASNLTAGMVNCTNGNVVVGFLNRDGNTINFRVNQVNVTQNIGTQCTLEGIQVSR